MSSNTDTTDQSGGSSSTTLVFILVSVVLGVVFYILIRYGRSAIREWHSRINGDVPAQAPTFSLSPLDVEAFPTFIYQGTTQNGSGNNDVSGNHNGHSTHNSKCNGNGKMDSKRHGISVHCSICLCDLEEDDVVRMLPLCRHFFHVQCIDVWLYSHPSCPICRARLQIESVALTECSMSPPLPQFHRYCNSQGSGKVDTSATTVEVSMVSQIEEITEIMVEQETKMATIRDNILKRNLCNESSEVQIEIKDEVDIEICQGEYFGKSISCKEALWASHVGSPSQNVPILGSPETPRAMDEAMPEPENQEVLETTSIKGSHEIQVDVEM